MQYQLSDNAGALVYTCSLAVDFMVFMPCSNIRGSLFRVVMYGCPCTGTKGPCCAGVDCVHPSPWQRGTTHAVVVVGDCQGTSHTVPTLHPLDCPSVGGGAVAVSWRCGVTLLSWCCVGLTLKFAVFASSPVLLCVWILHGWFGFEPGFKCTIHVWYG